MVNGINGEWVHEWEICEEDERKKCKKKEGDKRKRAAGEIVGEIAGENI